jgi:hypothetical protein
MGRTAEQFCSRESMLWSPSEPTMTTSPSTTNVGEETPATAMTWQQKEDFGPVVVSESELRDPVHLPLAACEELEFISILVSTFTSTRLCKPHLID